MAICGVAFALVTGLVVLRTKGIFFIMVTLAFAQMLFYVFHDTKIGGGSDGIYIYTKPELKIGDFALANLDKIEHFYYLVFTIALLVYLLLRRVLGSSFGRALIGIKVNEHRMQALGFPVFRYKLAATCFPAPSAAFLAISRRCSSVSSIRKSSPGTSPAW
jgi:branched-chain amino acid transport system permease protein